VNVLALVAHGDDEALGCGGTLAKHAARGDRVWLITMADGVSSRGQGGKGRRDAGVFKSCDILGITMLHQFDFRDNQLDSYPLLELVQAVESKVAGKPIDRVYTHSPTDLNVDHRIVHDVALTVFRPVAGQTVSTILAFETLSASHWNGPGAVFSPQLFVDVSSYWEKKINALQAYDSELRSFPHARSLTAVEALARFRGTVAGLPLAEAFEVIRVVES